MHYCISVITETLPTKEELNELMKPYKNDTESPYEKIFTWDYFVIGGRYGGLLKINIKDRKDTGYVFKKHNGVDFYSVLFEKLSKNDFSFDETNVYMYMGSRDGVLYVDSAKIDENLILGSFEGYGFLERGSSICIRENYFFDLQDTGKYCEVINEHYAETFRTCIERNMGKFITIIDCHS